MLIEQLATSKHIAIDRFYRTLYESLLDPRLVSSSKHTLYLNLLYRALRSDLDIKRVKAFAKRMVQVVTLHQPPFICGVLYLLREMETTFPGLRSLLNDPEDDDQAGEENFRDVPDDGENLEIPGEPDQQVQSDHRSRLNNAFKSYDGRKRDPEYSQADKTCLWESVRVDCLKQLNILTSLDSISVPFPPIGINVCLKSRKRPKGTPEARSCNTFSHTLP